MKTYSSIMITVAAGLVWSGCVSPYDGTPDRTGTGALTGGAVGATSGALIGSTSGQAGEGALIGAAAGMILGGLVGHSMDQEEQARLKTQAPQTYVRVEQGQPLSVADIKALTQARISDDLIISQIRVSRTVFRLSSADIIDLHNSGVSDKVIDFMINTASSGGGVQIVPAPPPQLVYVPQAPPPSRVETVPTAPGPAYTWIAGEWIWNGSWVWSGGYWVCPPHPQSVWVASCWNQGPNGWYRTPGHWQH